MACSIKYLDPNGQLKENPIVSRMMSAVVDAVNARQIPTAKEVLKPLVDAALVTPKGQVLDKLETVHAVATVNALITTNYNVQKPLITLKGFVGKMSNIADVPYIRSANGLIASHGFHVYVNESVLESLSGQVMSILTPAQVGPAAIEVINDTKTRYDRRYIDAAAKAKAPAALREGQIVQRFVGNQVDSFDTEKSVATTSTEFPEDVAGQIAFMQNAFAEQGIEVQIIVDPELPVLGRVEATSATGAVIRLNPLKMQDDTHIHEPAHILVELLSVSHPAVAAAISELRGTELYRQVQKAYPELSGEGLDKEVVVTAMGLSGARLNRKNPNLFQRIFNRIVRALSEALGIPTKESAVEALTKKLLQGRFNRSEFYGSLESLAADSRGAGNESNLQSVVKDVEFALNGAIMKLERTEGNEKVSDALNIMKTKLATVKDVMHLSEFVEYSSKLLEASKNRLERVEQVYPLDTPNDEKPNISEEERLELITQLHTISGYISDFYGGMDPEKSIMTKIRNLVAEKKAAMGRNQTPASAEELEAVNTLENRLVYSIDGMQQVHNKYVKSAIPLIVDLILEYHTPEINDQIKELQDNIKKNRRLIAIEKDDEFIAIEKARKEKKITDEEAFDLKIELNIQQLENKRIGRATLINELREAQKDKSRYSYLMDPLIYSSQAGLQLFTKLVKTKFYEANDDTQETIHAVGEAYRKFSEVKGMDVNPEKFNEDILETKTYRIKNYGTEEYDEIEMVTFVQPYDVDKYKKAESDMYKALAAKWKKPEDREGMEEWLKNKTAVRFYYADVAAWYKENSEPTEHAKEQLQKLLRKVEHIKEQLRKPGNSPEAASYYTQELQEVNSMISKIYSPSGKQFKSWAVRPNDKYLNPKYEALKNNPAAFAYYNTLLDQYKASQKIIGKNRMVKNSWDEFSYVVPSILTGAIEQVQSKGAISTAKLQAREATQFLASDVNYGDVININREARHKQVPVFFTQPMSSKEVSRDIATSVVMFSGMANLYKHKSEIHGSVMLMRDIIEKRETLEVNTANNPIAYRLSEKIAGVKHQTKLDASYNFKHLSEWIDSMFFNEQDIRSNFEFLGKQWEGNKLAGKVAGYTAMNNLAFNTLQTTNQLLLDNVRLLEESVSSQYFSNKDLAWAKSEYHLGLSGMSQVKDLGAFFPNSKLGQAVEYFDALGEVLGVSMEKKTGPRALKLAGKIPMSLQAVVENETSVTRMLAILHSYTGKLKAADGKVIMNEKGQPASVWDVFEKDEKTGRFKISDKVANAKAIRIQIRDRISGLTKKTNQVKQKFDNAVLQRRWYGKLMLLFRRYFQPTLRKYWGHGHGMGAGIHRDLELGTLNEGLLHTFGRLMKESYKKSGNFISVYNMMTDMEKQNVKRLSVQASFYLTCAVIIMALTGDDEDEELSYAENFVLYQALRMQTELTQFIKPMEFLRMAVSPSAAVRPIQATADLVHHIMYEQVPALVTGDDSGLYYQRASGTHEKGDSKFLAKLEKLLPIVNGIEKSRTPEDAAKWFELPIGASK
jgi:hypothetical protein